MSELKIFSQKGVIKSIEYEKIWEECREAKQFNLFRKKHDLPLLYQRFKKELPGFKDWVKEFSLDYESTFSNAPHTGDFFIGDGYHEFIKYTEDNVIKYKIVNKLNDDLQLKVDIESGKTSVVNIKKFIPYICWSKNKYKEDTSKKVKRINILDLKNGIIPIVEIGERNLDFIRMDGIIIKDYPIIKTLLCKINFSSCNDWQIFNSHISDLNMEYCEVNRLKCINSEISISLKKCMLWNASFRDTKIINISLIKCDLVFHPLFQSCEISPHALTYEPELRNMPFSEKENNRVFRFLFQNAGYPDTAKKYYYLEKKYERKSLFESIKNNKKEDSTPKKIFRKIYHLKEYIISCSDNIIWGYGEKPYNIVALSCFIICFYSVFYFLYGPDETVGKMADSLYFSIVTFTTLGYGDIQPITTAEKIICSSEALIGAFSIGLTVAGYANRFKY